MNIAIIFKLQSSKQETIFQTEPYLVAPNLS